MVRRFVVADGRVVELGVIRLPGVGMVERYAEVQSEYRGGPNDERGQKLREAALEKADRREWAHKRRGDETRFNE